MTLKNEEKTFWQTPQNNTFAAAFGNIVPVFLGKEYTTLPAFWKMVSEIMRSKHTKTFCFLLEKGRRNNSSCSKTSFSLLKLPVTKRTLLFLKYTLVGAGMFFFFQNCFITNFNDISRIHSSADEFLCIHSSAPYADEWYYMDE